MNKIQKILENWQEEELKDLLAEKEIEFYEGDTKDISLLLGYAIPNYNQLTELLGITDQKEAIYTEMFGNGPISNKIDAYQTNIDSLYFIRKEQYGLRDEDAMLCKLVFTQDLDNTMQKEKEELSHQNLIQERNKSRQSEWER